MTFPLAGPPNHDGIDCGLGNEIGFLLVTVPGLLGDHEIPWGLDGFDHLLSRSCGCGPTLERIECVCGRPICPHGGWVYRHRLVRE